jgi:sec-independent protein translocase protein TatC
MSKNTEGTFWSHIEVLRWMIIRCFIVVITIAIVAFLFKDFVFDDIILAPCNNNFITYKTLCLLGQKTGMTSICPNIQDIKMININLAAQLFTHISISFYIGLIIAFPYLMIELWMFVSPALYKKEKGPAIKGTLAFAILFFIGIFIAYYVIFPLTLNFLGSYQVSKTVVNQISLNSYINTFLTLIFMMGLVFELPIVAYFFAKIGILSSSFLSKNRKYAFVIVLVAAAFITPSTDVFTMMLVAVPLQLLYEISLLVVKKVERKKQAVKN